MKLKIAIASDHGGFELKAYLVMWLKENNFDVTDLGNLVYDKEDDYPDFANKLAQYVSNGYAERGILICGSGVGACISANKTKGIRASICHDTYSAHQGVEHDNMNVICFGARVIGADLAKELVTAFLNAKFFNEGRFKRRFDKLLTLEKN